MVGTLTDPVSDQLQDAVQTGLLETHTHSRLSEIQC